MGTKVRVVKHCSGLTDNGVYDLLGEDESNYYVFSDQFHRRGGWFKNRFEVIEPGSVVEDPKGWLTDPTKGAVKFDQGKPRVSLIPRPALEAEARVMALGAGKYGEDNWRKNGGMSFRRVGDAALRHLIAWLDGEDNDPETGENHLAHLRCNAAFLITYQAEGNGLDDRYKR